MSAYWPITPTGLSGKSSTQQGMRPWFPLSVSLCLHPTKKLLIWLQGEMPGSTVNECIHSGGWNKHAFFFSCRIEQLYQNVLALWHHSHINMKSVVSWHYLMADIRAIRNWNVASVCYYYFSSYWSNNMIVQHQLILINNDLNSDDWSRGKKTDMFPLFI